MKYFNKLTCLNPVAVQGRQLKDIIFFNEDGIQFRANRGWLEDSNTYPRRIPLENVHLCYDEVLKVKRKEVFNKEKIFLMNEKAEYFEREKYYVIYIHTDFIKFEKGPDMYSSSMNHCYREYDCYIDGFRFIVHEGIDEPLQRQASKIKHELLNDVKKKIDLMSIRGDFAPLFKEIIDLQNEYDKLQNEILKRYKLA